MLSNLVIRSERFNLTNSRPRNTQGHNLDHQAIMGIDGSKVSSLEIDSEFQEFGFYPYLAPGAII